jgi:hypothetical protein
VLPARDQAIGLVLAAGMGRQVQAGGQRARRAGGACGAGQAVTSQFVRQAPVALAAQEGGDAAKFGAETLYEGARQVLVPATRAPDKHRQTACVEFVDHVRVAGSVVNQAAGVVVHGAFEPRVDQQQRTVSAQQPAGVVQECEGRSLHGVIAQQ